MRHARSALDRVGETVSVSGHLHISTGLCVPNLAANGKVAIFTMLFQIFVMFFSDLI